MIRALLFNSAPFFWDGNKEGNSTFYVGLDEGNSKTNKSGENDQKYSFLQFALFNFRESLERYEMLQYEEVNVHGTVKRLENIKMRRTGRQKDKNMKDFNWTWKEITDLIKYTKVPISASLLKMEHPYLSHLAVECFRAVMLYMGDYPREDVQTEEECVYTLLAICYRHPHLRDEVYCQLMKQTTNNKSHKEDSCLRGWRLFSVITAFFDCSPVLKPYLFVYLETAAHDNRREEHGNARVCLQNLQKTFKYGGRRNVPSVEEIKAISAGVMTGSQIYYFPGGIQQIVGVTATTVVQDVLEILCHGMGIEQEIEMEEYCLYCIVEGDESTMALNKDEYVLDLTTEMEKNRHMFYLVFCRATWYYPLKLNVELSVKIVFNQVVPDYLQGFLLVVSKRRLSETTVADIARISALLHRAANSDYSPTEKEVTFSLPKPVLYLDQMTIYEWTERVQENWQEMTALTPTEAKAQFLDIIQKWHHFGSCFFAAKMIQEDGHCIDHILAVNKEGLSLLDSETHEIVWKFNFSAFCFIQNVSEDHDIPLVDIICGDVLVKKTIRLQADHAHEVSRLVNKYMIIQEYEEAAERIHSRHTHSPSVVVKV